MKKIIFILLFFVLSLVLVTGCRKDNKTQEEKNSESVKMLKELLLTVQEKGESGAGFIEISEKDFLRGQGKSISNAGFPENFHVFKKGDIYLFENDKPKSARTLNDDDGDDDNEEHSSYGYIVNSDYCICSTGLVSCLWRSDFLIDDCRNDWSVGVINVAVPRTVIIQGNPIYHGATWYSLYDDATLVMELPNSKGEWVYDCYISSVPDEWIKPVN